MKSRTPQSRIRPILWIIGALLIGSVFLAPPASDEGTTQVTLDQLETLIADNEVATA